MPRPSLACLAVIRKGAVVGGNPAELMADLSPLTVPSRAPAGTLGQLTSHAGCRSAMITTTPNSQSDDAVVSGRR